MTSGFEAWFLGGLLSLWVESCRWPLDLFMAWDCVKCLEIKGLAGGQ